MDRERAKTNSELAEKLQRLENGDRLVKSMLLWQASGADAGDSGPFVCHVGFALPVAVPDADVAVARGVEPRRDTKAPVGPGVVASVPKHPKFELEVKHGKDFRQVLEVCLAAARTPDRRVYIEDQGVRKMPRCMYHPLELGKVSETHVVSGDD